MIELEVDGSTFMTLNDDNSIKVNDKKKLGLDEDAVKSDNIPSFVTIEDIN